MNIIYIKVYPTLGYSSYTIVIDYSDFWKNKLDKFVEGWISDNLINVDHWEYVNKREILLRGD